MLQFPPTIQQQIARVEYCDSMAKYSIDKTEENELSVQRLRTTEKEGKKVKSSEYLVYHPLTATTAGAEPSADFYYSLQAISDRKYEW